MAESESPEDERQDPPAETGDAAAETPDAETPDAAAETPDAPAETPDAAAETPGPAAGDDVPAEGVTEALEAAAEEIPDSDVGPGEGLTPEPPPGAEAAPVPVAPAEAASGSEDAVPGAHLEPDLVLEERREESPTDVYSDSDSDQDAQPQASDDAGAGAEQPAPIAGTPMDLAADARYQATGKRKSSVARVILRPGSGAYTVNGRPLAAFFPRPTLQKRVQQPLETAGYELRMDVVARIHGGGVSSQAGALRHGVAKALVAADPNLRQELKRRGFLTRDARVKERKKAGLKKARKRPQFSKR